MYLDSGYDLTVRNSELPTNIDAGTVASDNATDVLHTQSYETWHKVLKAAKAASIPTIPTGSTTPTTPTAADVVTAALAVNGSTALPNAMQTAINSVSSATDGPAAYKALVALPAIADGDSNFARTFTFGTGTEDAVEKSAGVRHANSSRVKVEIRCGRDKSNIFSLSAVQIDYVKAPQFIRLTQEQLDSDEDISQIMEFPDYVNQEIVNELVNLVMRKTNDPSLQAHIQMTQSIARPTGQSQAQPAAQA
jgi:hypothetical protein